MAVEDHTNSPSVVMMKSRFPKCTRAPGTQLTLRLAIRGLVLMSRRAKMPLPGAPIVGVSSKHRLVNLYIACLTRMVC